MGAKRPGSAGVRVELPHILVCSGKAQCVPVALASFSAGLPFTLRIILPQAGEQRAS